MNKVVVLLLLLCLCTSCASKNELSEYNAEANQVYEKFLLNQISATYESSHHLSSAGLEWFSQGYDDFVFLIDDINGDGKVELVIHPRELFIFSFSGEKLVVIDGNINYTTLHNEYIFYYHRHLWGDETESAYRFDKDWNKQDYAYDGIFDLDEPEWISYQIWLNEQEIFELPYNPKAYN